MGGPSTSAVTRPVRESTGRTAEKEGPSHPEVARGKVADGAAILPQNALRRPWPASAKHYTTTGARECDALALIVC
jgi:hypothetical protein